MKRSKIPSIIKEEGDQQPEKPRKKRDALSITKAKITQEDLDGTVLEKGSGVLKAILSELPGVGGALGDALSSFADRRLDRAITFLKELDDRVGYLSRDVQEWMKREPAIADLIAEALEQAVKTDSDERRRYLASLLINGMTRDDIDLIDTKKLLDILRGLNDAEIIVLKDYSYIVLDAKKSAFRNQHKDIFKYEEPSWGAGEKVLNKAAVRGDLRDNLIRQGLLKPVLRLNGGKAEIDPKTGAPVIASYEVTPLGRLFLTYIENAPSQADSTF
jgi:hypothetical protein